MTAPPGANPIPQPRPPAPMDALVRRIFGERTWPVMLTKSGVIFLAICVFVLVATVNSQSNLLFFTFGMMMGAIVISLLLSAICLRNMHVRRDFGEHAVAGEPSDIEFVVENHKRFWPCFGVQLREVNPGLEEAPRGFILYIPVRDSVAFSTRLLVNRRGLLKLSEIELSTSFPFGFIRRTRRFRAPQDLVVYPRLGMLNRHLALQYRESIETGTMTANRRGGNDEFYGLREYRAGDNIRAIHWRSSARTGELMIRETAANAPPQLIVMLNLRSARAQPAPAQVERAIELAAALVCYGFYENFAVGLAIAGLPGHPSPVPTMGRDARARMLKELAMLNPADIRDDIGIDFPNRLAGRAEWVIVTLRASDPYRDLLSNSGSGGPPATGAMGGALGSHRTVLALDSRESANWVHFLSAKDSLRLLRDRS